MTLDYDLEIEQGSDYERAFPILDDNNQLVVVTDWNARAQIRRTPTSPIPRLSFNTAAEEQIEGVGLEIDGDHVILRIPGTISALWAWSEGAWDLELVDPGGSPRRFVKGHVYVDRETTR